MGSNVDASYHATREVRIVAFNGSGGGDGGRGGDGGGSGGSGGGASPATPYLSRRKFVMADSSGVVSARPHVISSATPK